MANKLFLNNEDIPYEPSESEDELSEGEKQILKEVRRGKTRKTDAKQEILAFDESAESDEDDIISDSDIERGDENDDIPDSKAWGKQRRSYYNTDFVDQDYSAYNEQEEEQAQQEEEEAKAIQMRLAKHLDEADFFLDLPVGVASDSEDGEDTKPKSKSKKSDQSTNLKSDLSNMSKRQIQQLLEKDSPEFAGLVEDFHTYLDESKNILTPVIDYADSINLNLPIFDFVRTRDNMIMTYCTNVAFYLLLKSQRISIKNHPITKRLVTLKKLINQVQGRYEDVVKPQLEDLLERINSGEEIQFDLRPIGKAKEKSKKKLGIMKKLHDEVEDGDSGEEYVEKPDKKRAKIADQMDDDGSTDENDKEQEDDEEGDVERRGITYQIAKNKGLMPHRKKELRNPRVKHRSKFRKALIRRKGAVRTVRKETQRYGGEVSGIKATTKKGIKIKS